MTQDYFVIGIKTCPIDYDAYARLPSDEASSMLNPIESRIIAVGFRYNNKTKIFFGEEEPDVLWKMWKQWRYIKHINPRANIVGFNIKGFDLPFITTRSLIRNVPILPFTIKEIVDLREKITAYRHGHNRGGLKDFASCLGIDSSCLDGRKIPDLWIKKDVDSIVEHASKELEIADKLYHRVVDTNIIQIEKW